MPQLPYGQEVDATSGRYTGERYVGIQVNTNPSAFGVDNAQALQQGGQEIQRAGGLLGDYAAKEHDKKKTEFTANTVATSMSNWPLVEQSVKDTTAPDGHDYLDNLSQAYDDHINNTIGDITDTDTANAVRTRMLAEKPDLMSRAESYKNQISELNSKTTTETALNGLQNGVMLNSDPNFYTSSLKQGLSVIQSTTALPAAAKAEASAKFVNDHTDMYFQGMVQKAKTPADLDTISSTLAGDAPDGKAWTTKFNPEQFKLLEDKLGTMRRSLQEHIMTGTRAMLTQIKERQEKGEPVSDKDLADASAQVRMAGDVPSALEMAKFTRANQIINTAQRLAPADIKNRIDNMAVSPGKDFPNTPPEVTKNINEASNRFGVSAGLLSGLVQTEYGKYLHSKVGPVSYGQGTDVLGPDGKPVTSATGIGQFTNDTWLGLVKDQTVQASLGLDVHGKTDAQLLALRADPKVAIPAMAINALKNKADMETALGRPVNDAEISMAHVMGATGAVGFLTAYQNAPDKSAAEIMPEAAKNNPGLYYANGKPKTVSQVYNDISDKYNLAPSKIAYEDLDTWKRMLEKTDKEIKDDPMSHAQTVGSHVVTPLDNTPESFRTRATQAMAVAEYNNIPLRNMQPFMKPEADAIKGQIDTGTADDTVRVMANISAMGDKMGHAAMSQLEVKDPVFGHAGSLYLDGNTSVAGDIIRGRKMLTENPGVKNQMGVKDDDLAAAFTKAAGTSLNNIDPGHRQAIQDAALAYYVQQQSSKGQSYKFDPNQYGTAVDAVMGGTPNAPAFDTVNGYTTLMPRGISSSDLHTALQKMGLNDYIRMSKDGRPPMYRDGKLVDPRQLQDEVMLQAKGGNEYRLMMDDGSILTTGTVDGSGRMNAYIFVPDAKALKNISLRPDEVASGNAYAQGLGEGTVR